jgi:hypothetical protein
MRRARFPARFKLRSRHFRLHPQTSSGLEDPVRFGGRLSNSCRASYLVLTEYGAVDPQAMQKNGKFTGDGHYGASTTFAAYQPHAPRLDLHPRHRSHEECVCGGI